MHCWLWMCQKKRYEWRYDYLLQFWSKQSVLGECRNVENQVISVLFGFIILTQSIYDLFAVKMNVDLLYRIIALICKILRFLQPILQHQLAAIQSSPWIQVLLTNYMVFYSSLPNKRTCTPHLILTKLPLCTLFFGPVRLFVFGIWNFLSNIQA